MENFDIVKYLRENHLGSHAILGNYVDLHALKEVEDTEDLEVVKGFGALKDKSVADKYAEVAKQAGMEGVKVVEKDGVFKIYAKAGQKLNKEAEDIKGIETSDLKKGDTVEYEGNEYKIGDFDTAGGANLVYLNTMDGKPAEDSKGRYKKVHKSRVKKLNKEADYGNNQPVDEVPYAGDEEKLDGFGDEFDQVDPVEEMDNSVTGDKGWQYDDEEEDTSWMKDDRFADLGGDQIKAGIKSLMDDGFDAREIAQFVVDTIRAFKSFKEEVTVSSSGVEMKEALSYEDLENDLNKIAIKMRKIATFNHNNAGDFTFVTITVDDDDSPAYNKKVQNAGYKEVVTLINKKYPTLKVIEKEQDLNKVSFVIARNDKKKLGEAEMYTVDFGTNTQSFELDRDRNVLIGLKPQMGLPGSSPREQDIIPVMIDANGFLYTKDPRVKDISPASNASPFSDPGYMNRD